MLKQHLEFFGPGDRFFHERGCGGQEAELRLDFLEAWFLIGHGPIGLRLGGWRPPVLQQDLRNCTQRIDGPISELSEQTVSNPNTGSCSWEGSKWP